MALNGSGTFVRLYNWVTDRDASVAITASRMDAEMDGMATALSTMICLDGQSTTTAAIPFAVGITINDGTVGTPPLRFTADTDSGLYRIGANNIGIGVNGAKVLDIATGGLGITGGLTVSTTLGVTGIATFTAAPVFSSGTASQSVELDSGKALTTVAITGTGNYVKSASPTMTGTIGAASMTLSGTLGVTGHTTFEGVTSTGATGTGKLVYDGSPTLVTPALGVASATSLTVSGATTLSNITVGIGGTPQRNCEIITSDANTTWGGGVAQFPFTIRNTDTTDNNWMTVCFAGGTSLAYSYSLAVQIQNHTTHAGRLQFLNYATASVLELTALGSVVVGSAAIATNATDGFLYIPTCAGTPSGTPTAFTGRDAVVYDTTNNKLYVYNGAWKSVTLA